MENWEQTQEAMKAMKSDIKDLKDQMSQIHGLKDQMSHILEVLTILNSKREATISNEEAQSSHPPIFQQGTSQTRDLNQGNQTNQEFPLYGPPLNYEPSYEKGVEQETIPQVVNTASAKGQPEFTQVPPVDHGENVVINKIPSTIQSQVLQFLTGEPFSTKVDIPEDIQNVLLNADRTKTKLEVLEERLRMIEGGGSYEFGDAVGLCLVPDVVIPPKFKAVEFEKYKGVTCPKGHLTMYCRKMAAHSHDEKLLIHFFQESLTGNTLNWYMHLEPARIRS